MAEHPKLTPTASSEMMQATSLADRNQLTNGAINNLKKTSRTRSKSESHHPSSDKQKELYGVVVKSAKDRAHDRKPKNMKGSGKPKKAGGGGKGTWGKNGEIYEEECNDPQDPNYDSETDKPEDLVMQEVIPDLTSAEFDVVVTPLLQEFFEHGITFEVIEPLKELNITHLKHRIVYLLVTLALEKKGAQRELASVLLSDLYGERLVCEQDMELGFQALMNVLPDLQLDTPDATTILGQFMARCIADDCLNPIYIREHLEHPNDIQRQALTTANTYLQSRHGLVRLDTVWGFGGGNRPVKTLIKEIVLMIREYLASKDMAEAERCLSDLDVPHFHHEIVYEAIQIALENNSGVIIEAIVGLLKHFFTCGMVSIDQMNSGFKRIFESMDDIVIDVPRAYKYLDVVLDKSCRAGIIPLAMRQSAPSRGRKRFVSEGDFGMSPRPLI